MRSALLALAEFVALALFCASVATWAAIFALPV